MGGSTKDLVSLLQSGKEADQLRERLVEFLLESSEPKSADEQQRALLGAYEQLRAIHRFEPGQFVRWKKGLKNRRLPREHDLAIVIEVVPSGVVDTDQNSGSPYFREPLDLVLGVIDPDGEFGIYHFDKRRFEPAEDSTTQANPSLR